MSGVCVSRLVSELPIRGPSVSTVYPLSSGRPAPAQPGNQSPVQPQLCSDTVFTERGCRRPSHNCTQ